MARSSERGGVEKVAYDANHPRASSLGVLVCVCTLLSSYRMRRIRKVDVGIIALATDRLIKHSLLRTVAISRNQMATDSTSLLSGIHSVSNYYYKK